MGKFHISGVPICDADGKLVGIITNRDLKFMSSFDVPIGEVMTKEHLITAPQGITLEEAKALLLRSKVEKLPIVDENDHLLYFVFRKEVPQCRPRQPEPPAGRRRHRRQSRYGGARRCPGGSPGRYPGAG